MKKILFGILAVVVLAGGAIFVVAQKGRHFGGPGFGMGPGHGGRIGMALRGLDLTDDQKAKVKSIMEASRADIQPLMQQLRENHKTIAALDTNGTFDQAKVEAAAAEQGSVMAKLIVEREKVKSQIFAILTDDQKAKAAAMRAKFEEHFKDGKGFEGKPRASEF